MRHRVTLCVALLVLACAPKSADEKDWRETQAKVTGFESEHAAYARGHLERYPNCPHRRSVEAFFLTRCTRDVKSCAEYFELFPAGERKSEAEAVVWQACEAYVNGFHYELNDCSYCCDLYRKNFPDSPNIGALARMEERKVKEREAEHAELEKLERENAARETQAWSGELVDLTVEFPPDATSLVTLAVMGRAIHPQGHGTITVPLGYPVDVCYRGDSPSYSLGECVPVQPLGSSLRVPLTRVYLSYPSSLMAWCYATWPPPKELWVMPGPHTVSCQFDRSLTPDISQSTKDDVEVTFNAPETGGTVHVVFTKEGNAVRGEALISSEWQDRLFPE